MTVMRIAARTRLAGIELLLRNAGLPTTGVGDCLDDFLLSLDQEDLVGCVGLELCGEAALLRSLAVRAAYGGRGEARRLVQAAERHATGRGVRHVYLLTTTAEGFFEKLSYRRISRDSAPAAILATEEFRLLCPSEAAYMWRPL